MVEEPLKDMAAEDQLLSEMVNQRTFKPGIIPSAASKHAPDIRPCSRNSGLGASPSLPSGSEPMTLKYLAVQGYSLH